MIRHLPCHGLLLAAIALFPVDGDAQLYQWVDENGKIHYSDQAPDDEVKTRVIAAERDKSAPAGQSPGIAARPIIRPYERTARRLHLLDTRYLWKSEAQVDRVSKLGVYHSGRGCTTRGAMKTPDVFIHHKSFFPSESSLSHRISKVINGLDYEAERTEKYRLLSRLKKTGGLSMHAEIIDLDIDSCAPSIRKSERLKAIETISAHRFTKHRVRLQVRWQLRSNRDQDVIFEAVTAGSYNGWNQSARSEAAIGNALEDAVLKLFSDRDFIARVLVEEDGVDLAELEHAGPKPINLDAATRTRKLFVLAEGKRWIKDWKPDAPIGRLLFGEKCAAQRPLPLADALVAQKWLAADSYSAGNAIVRAARPLGYSISAATGDALNSFDDSGGYALNARITRVTYDACAPALSASAKYKPIDKISFRNLQRNRVQVWVEWTLNSDRNRKLLYKTGTMGFAGSLRADVSGKEAMADAIGMAAEQLFADPDFVQLIKVEPRALPADQEFAARDNSSVRGIVLPGEQQAVKLIVANAVNPWARLAAQQKIGFYGYGSECLPFRERSWPQALNDYPRAFPDSGEFVSAESRVIKSLGYSFQVADEYSVVSIKRKLGGYSLHADIVDLRFDSCAPDLEEEKIFSGRKISDGRFKRHRAILRIRWRLLDGSDERLFEDTTEGVADSWLLNSSGNKVIAQAVANATSELFAQPQFVALLSPQPGDEGGFFTNLMGIFGSGQEREPGAAQGAGNRFVLQAHAAQAFSELNMLKIGAVEHFMMQGEWPDNLSQLGYSESMFNHSETIDYINFQPDGSMVVELKEIFGSDKIITLRPASDGGGMSMNRWECSSNLEQSYLPRNCEGL